MSEDPLRIRLFGDLEITWQDASLRRFPTRKAQSLFAYLALHAERPHARQTLAGLFWPESSEIAARRRLRTELWHLRRFLATFENGHPVILVDNGSIGIHPAAEVWIDRVEFEEKLVPLAGANGGLTVSEARDLAAAVALYRGHLLEGSYEDWCVDERERLRVRLLEALERLTTFHRERGEPDLAIHYCQELLRHEPLAEHIHRELMQGHWQKRNRTAALRQYERCVAVLACELDVEPMPETVELCRRIRGGHA